MSIARVQAAIAGWRPGIGDTVYCPHAEAYGCVTYIDDLCVMVRVTAAYGALYKVGMEYAWLHSQVGPSSDPGLNLADSTSP